MPRIISVGHADTKKGSWKGVPIEQADFQDDNFAFLSTFEEFLPDDCTTVRLSKNGDVIPSSKKVSTKGEKQKNRKRTLVDDTNNEEEKTEPKKKKKKGEVDEMGKKDQGKMKKTKRKKKKKKKNVLANDSQGKTVANDESSSNLVNESDFSEWSQFFLPEAIMKNIKALGFTTPTPIQREAIPSGYRDRLDIVGAAETGSGKTLAFAIPVVVGLFSVSNHSHVSQQGAQNYKGRLLEEERIGRGPRALILAPTRELVVQIRQHVDALIRGTSFRAASIVGGLSQQKQERIMKYRPEIVVASPGRLWALMQLAEAGSYLTDFSGLLCIVIDETDRMAEKGHFEELEHVVREAKRVRGDEVQTLVFSATLSFTHLPSRSNQLTQDSKQKLKHLIEAAGIRKERKIFDLSGASGTASTLTESRLNCDNLLGKDTSLVYLLRRYEGRSLIFCNSVDAVRRLYGILSKMRFSPLLLHAKMNQKKRLQNLEKFAERADGVLLATDLAARGLDIKGIQHVFHYQVPKTAEIYIHRSGRAGRASVRGLSILLVDPTEASFYRRICANLNRAEDLPVFPVDCEALFRCLRQQVSVASELDSVEHRIKKRTQRESWFEKTAREADLDLDERADESSQTKGEIADLARKEKGLNQHLRALLAQGLPEVDRANLPYTRYVDGDLVARFEKKATREAMRAVEESVEAAKDNRKKARRLITTKQLRMKKVKSKKTLHK